MPISHRAAPRMHSESAFPLNAESSAPLHGSHSSTTHHPTLKEREQRRASYAKVPHKQQLAHNKSAVKDLLSMTQKPPCINKQRSQTYREPAGFEEKNSSQKMSLSLPRVTPMAVSNAAAKIKRLNLLFFTNSLTILWVYIFTHRM